MAASITSLRQTIGGSRPSSAWHGKVIGHFEKTLEGTAQRRKPGPKQGAELSMACPELRNYADCFVRRLRPSAPITWFASLMGNGDDEHNVRQHFVHHGIGEAANQQPSKSAIAWGARLWGMKRTIEAPPYLIKEGLAKTR
jgi:hypothetical protein